jgi:hypothetical protein
MIEQLQKLHPVVACVLIIAVAAILCVFYINFGKQLEKCDNT